MGGMFHYTLCRPPCSHMLCGVSLPGTWALVRCVNRCCCRAVQFKQFRIFGLIPVTAPDRAKGKLDTTFLDEELRIRCLPPPPPPPPRGAGVCVRVASVSHLLLSPLLDICSEVFCREFRMIVMYERPKLFCGAAVLIAGIL